MAKIINRLASMLLDHFVMSFLLVPLIIGYLIVLQLVFESAYPDSMIINDKISYTVFFLPFFIYFLKDSYKGKSIGKRVIGLQVVNRKTNQEANYLQCFIRNLFIIIWPIEVLISFLNPERRIGDLFANTRVVVSQKEEIKTIFKDIKKTKFSIISILILLIGLLYFYILSSFMVFLNTL